MILASRIDIRKPRKHRNEIQCECLVSNVKFNLHVYKNLTLKTTTYTVILPNQSVALLAHIRLKYVSAVLLIVPLQMIKNSKYSECKRVE